MPAMTLIVIYNPACGDSAAEQFMNAHVIPRLHSASRIPTEIIRTRAPGHAGVEVLDCLNKYKGDITVVLGSGDGTLHEIVNRVAFAVDAGIHDGSSSINFALVPCGTANALYASLFKPTTSQDPIAYRLQSLEVLLRSSTRRPLTLSLTSLLGPLGSLCEQDGSQLVASIVVTSTALHAAILRDSERFRKEIPGIERFKVAAQQNITKWYAARVKLLPVASSGTVHIYDPEKGRFVPFGSNESNSALDVHGPFAYFLSTVNVDRLEPEFRISPMASKIPPMDTTMDVIIVRPQRDPTFMQDTLQARENFASKTYTVLTAAYQDGNHINLRYSENGDIAENGLGSTVVEYFRCGGWEWIPDKADKDAHSLCADGAIFEIELGGRATCQAATGIDATLRNFYIHV